MFVHETQIRVRYSETDRMNYVYYGNYPQYFEVGRVEAMRSIGISYKDLEENHGVMMPVKSMSIKYLRPVFYDELITVKTTVSALPERSINFHVEIFNEKGEITTGGSVSLAFVNIETKESIPCPEILIKQLAKYFDV